MIPRNKKERAAKEDPIMTLFIIKKSAHKDNRMRTKKTHSLVEMGRLKLPIYIPIV